MAANATDMCAYCCGLLRAFRAPALLPVRLMKAAGSFNHNSFCFLIILPEGHAFCGKKRENKQK